MRIRLQGYTAVKFCWDLVLPDELLSMTRWLPDMLRFIQKHECPGKESKNELKGHGMNFTSLRVDIEKE